MEQQSSLQLKKSIEKHQNKSWINLLSLTIPAVLLAAATLPFRNVFTLAEGDLTRMMSALVYWNVAGDKLMADFRPYGIDFSYGWYEMLNSIAPQGWLSNPDLAALLINRFGIISGLLCALACTVYLSALFGRGVAIAAATLFFLSPMMLPVAFSGHPEMGAAACLFVAGWLFSFTEDSDKIGLTWGYYLGALILLTFGLTLRVDIVMAFPFVWLVAKNGGIDRQFWLARYGLRGLVLAAAFGIFLIMQRHYLSSSDGAAFVLADFVERFLSPSKIVKGLVVLTLSIGGATLVAVIIALMRGLRCKQRDFYLLLVLALPPLALFLPNPLPARHFFFPVLAVCVCFGLLIKHWQPKNVWMLVVAVGVALMNQVVIEIVHPAVTSRATYVQNYPSLTARRYTPAAPSGAFIFDEPALQANEEGERLEAKRLGAQSSERLVVLADHMFYIIAYLFAQDPKLRCVYESVNGIKFLRLQSETRTVVLIERYISWPQDITPVVLQQQAWQGWPVYVQPSTKSRYDKTEIPADRLYKLPDFSATPSVTNVK